MHASPPDDPRQQLHACTCCGLIQTAPPLAKGEVARCRRCRTVLAEGTEVASNLPAVMAASAALILYFPAITLPIMRLEQLGHRHESSLLGGGIQLFQYGEFIVATVVLLCSVFIPLFKLLALLLLSLRPPRRAHHVASTYRLVEHLGRWGMVDVLLVAVVVAALKLGDLVSVQPGPAALLFTCMVVLNLFASAWFDPRKLWMHHHERRSNQS
ncbi:MAG: paraquat-inducible protein A [Planctomycetota bacterium]|nr:MAG: paraquat-inducible protein A [Planctomycetota bacterium]